MRRFLIALFAVSFSVPALAHHPDRANHPVVPYFDLIPPLGNRLPMSYRRRYNRPRHVGGKIAYYIAPSSQEAMSVHEHVHRGSYKNHAGLIFKQYYYSKPWEAMTVGPRSDFASRAPKEVVIDDPMNEPSVVEEPQRSEF